jgi:hypothetical protein
MVLIFLNYGICQSSWKLYYAYLYTQMTNRLEGKSRMGYKPRVGRDETRHPPESNSMCPVRGLDLWDFWTHLITLFVTSRGL